MAALLLRPRTWVIPYVLVWFGVGLLPFQPTDLDIFFWPSAKVAVHGHPLLLYSANGQALYPNANGPLSMVPLSALAWVLNLAGWLDAAPLRRAAALGVFCLFTLLMSREAIAAIERLRGSPMPDMVRLLGYFVLALNTQVWQSVAGYGHIEQPIEIWLLLVAVRWLGEGRALPAGLAFGLSIMTRSSAVLMTVPLGLAAWRQGAGKAIVLVGSAAGAAVAVLLPFLLADPTDVVHSLFTYRGALKIGAGSVWTLARGTALEPLVQHWDIVPILAAVIAANLWLVWGRGLDEARVFAAMAATAAAFAMFAKTVWPYYLFEMFVFGTVWAAGTWRPAFGVIRLVLIPLAVSVFGLIAEIGSEQNLPQILVRTEGPAMFVMLGLTLVWMLWFATRESTAPPGMTAPAVWLKQRGPEAADRR